MDDSPGFENYARQQALVIELFAGARRIGFLKVEDFDWPKYFCAFTPTTEFESVREVFEAQWSWKRLEALDLRLRFPDGREERLFAIAIEGDRAMWREGFLRSTMIRLHDSFWSTLGEEAGPEKCRRPGCARLRIALSVFCKRHHFRMIMKEEYAGSLDP